LSSGVFEHNTFVESTLLFLPVETSFLNIAPQVPLFASSSLFIAPNPSTINFLHFVIRIHLFLPVSPPYQASPQESFSTLLPSVSYSNLLLLIHSRTFFSSVLILETFFLTPFLSSKATSWSIPRLYVPACCRTTKQVLQTPGPRCLSTFPLTSPCPDLDFFSRPTLFF